MFVEQPLAKPVHLLKTSRIKIRVGNDSSLFHNDQHQTLCMVYKTDVCPEGVYLIYFYRSWIRYTYCARWLYLIHVCLFWFVLFGSQSSFFQSSYHIYLWNVHIHQYLLYVLSSACLSYFWYSLWPHKLDTYTWFQFSALCARPLWTPLSLLLLLGGPARHLSLLNLAVLLVGPIIMGTIC